MYTLGRKRKFGTYHPSIIFDEDGEVVLTISGFPENTKLEELPDFCLERLEFAQLVVRLLNEDLVLKASEQ